MWIKCIIIYLKEELKYVLNIFITNIKIFCFSPWSPLWACWAYWRWRTPLRRWQITSEEGSTFLSRSSSIFWDITSSQMKKSNGPRFTYLLFFRKARTKHDQFIKHIIMLTQKLRHMHNYWFNVMKLSNTWNYNNLYIN